MGTQSDAIATAERLLPGLLRALVEPQPKFSISTSDFVFLCGRAQAVVLRDPPLIDLALPCTVIGDIHGQHTCLAQVIADVGLPPQDGPLLFLGDYVDRGDQCVLVVAVLFAIKCLFPQHVFLLRGNHESATMNAVYGFLREVRRRFGIAGRDVWLAANAVFDCLPVAALCSDWCLCVHAGISPQLESLQQVRALRRPCQIPISGWLCDFVWGDATREIQGVEPNRDRGVGVRFGAAAAGEFLRRHGLRAMLRGHQASSFGVAFPFGGAVPFATVMSSACDGGTAGYVRLRSDRTLELCTLHTEATVGVIAALLELANRPANPQPPPEVPLSRAVVADVRPHAPLPDIVWPAEPIPEEWSSDGAEAATHWWECAEVWIALLAVILLFFALTAYD